MATMSIVSVLLPVYNTNPAHLRAAIDSVLAQSFTNFELLIHNDASTHPEVEQVCRSYTDPRVHYLHGTTNLGIAGVRNALIERAQGEYLAVMDHDDLCLPERLEAQVRFMDAHPDVGVCGTAHRRFGKPFKNDTIRYPQDDATIRAALFFKNVIHHPSAMMRKAVLIDHGIRYDETLISANDRKLFMDIAAHAKLHNLPQVLCRYRLHGGMTSQTRRAAIIEEQKRLRLDFLQRMGAELSADELATLNDYVMRGRARITQRAQLKAIEAVLSKLSQTNARTQFFSSPAFDQLCAQYLVKRCRNAAWQGFVRSKTILATTALPVAAVRKPLWLRLVNGF